MDYYIGILFVEYETTKVYQHTNQSLVECWCWAKGKPVDILKHPKHSLNCNMLLTASSFAAYFPSTGLQRGFDVRCHSTHPKALSGGLAGMGAQAINVTSSEDATWRMPHDRCWKMLKDADCVFSWSVANLRHDEISCKCFLFVSYCELMIFSLSMLKLLEFLIAPNIEPTPFFPEFHGWKIPVVIDFGKDFFPGADPDVDENYHELPVSIWCGPWGSKPLRKGDVAFFFWWHRWPT